MYCTINQLTNYRSTCLFDKIQSYILNKPISVVPIIDYSCQQYDNNSDWNKITICSFKVIPVMLKNYVLYNTCVIQLNTHSELVLLRLCGVLHAHFESLTAEIRVHHTGFSSVWPACPLLFFGGEPPAAPRSLPTRTYFFFYRSSFAPSVRPAGPASRLRRPVSVDGRPQEARLSGGWCCARFELTSSPIFCCCCCCCVGADWLCARMRVSVSQCTRTSPMETLPV